MKIPKDEQIKGVMCEDRLGWFYSWYKLTNKETIKKPSDLITIDMDDVIRYISNSGFDTAMVSYHPLESRYLIENIGKEWQVSFHERGARHGSKCFDSKLSAEKYIAEILITSMKDSIDSQFGSNNNS